MSCISILVAFLVVIQCHVFLLSLIADSHWHSSDESTDPSFPAGTGSRGQLRSCWLFIHSFKNDYIVHLSRCLWSYLSFWWIVLLKNSCEFNYVSESVWGQKRS